MIADYYILLTGFTSTATTASWTGEIVSDMGISYVYDHNDDGDLDSTGSQPDWFAGGAQGYSGFTIDIGGRTYAIFTNGYFGFIPYDSSVDDLSSYLPLSPQNTSDLLENGTPENFCFAKGTAIATPQGETAVQDLKIGDVVRTASGHDAPVKWLGVQTIRSIFGLNNERLQPVRIRAGALGNGIPHTDLTVTADHGMVLDGYVINASALVNHDTIYFVPLAELDDSFTVYHIETEAHDVILANGAPSETFIDAAGRAAFDNHQEYLDLYGAERAIPEMRLPRISSAQLVPQAVKERLDGFSSIRSKPRKTA